MNARKNPKPEDAEPDEGSAAQADAAAADAADAGADAADSSESTAGEPGAAADETDDAGFSDASEDGDTAKVHTIEDLFAAEGPDVELSPEDQGILDEAERDLVAEMRNDMLRAQAELVNFRTRVERDRVANRQAVIAEVIRTLLPALDDLQRAEAHGDLEHGSALAIVAQKLRAGFERYGLRPLGEKGQPFDPKWHEALVQLPTADVEQPTIADVIETGYALGDKLIRPAKVAVSVPE